MISFSFFNACYALDAFYQKCIFSNRKDLVVYSSGGGSPIVTVLTSVYASNPYSPSSRPVPDICNS